MKSITFSSGETVSFKQSSIMELMLVHDETMRGYEAAHPKPDAPLVETKITESKTEMLPDAKAHERLLAEWDSAMQLAVARTLSLYIALSIELTDKQRKTASAHRRSMAVIVAAYENYTDEQAFLLMNLKTVDDLNNVITIFSEADVEKAVKKK
jgi:uncharacterized protein YcbX